MSRESDGDFGSKLFQHGDMDVVLSVFGFLPES